MGEGAAKLSSGTRTTFPKCLLPERWEGGCSLSGPVLWDKLLVSEKVAEDTPTPHFAFPNSAGSLARQVGEEREKQRKSDSVSNHMKVETSNMDSRA